jgi:glucoamylase
MPAVVHWGYDGRHDIADAPTCDTGLGFHVAALNSSRLSPGARVDFTWRWQKSDNWIGGNYSVTMEPAGDPE